MTELKERKCPCCGAPVPNFKNVCDYCGMVFKDDSPLDIRYVGIRPNMRRVAASARVPDEWANRSADMAVAALSVAKNDIVRKLAEGLQDMVAWRLERDPRTFDIVVRGELWVQEPDARLVTYL